VYDDARRTETKQRYHHISIQRAVYEK